jgi:succinate dehydrogenase / fumarate reductase cytochrome b subunit
MAHVVTREPVSGTATRVRKRKPFLIDLYSTAVGKKYVMAITGLIGVGFVVVHMIGNLKAYLGVVNHHGERAYDLDIYGEWLRDLLVPGLPRTVFLWLLRFVLIGAVALHLHAAYTLTIMNRRARPVGYQSSREYVTANFASRTMRWTGVIFLLFLVWHLADFTWGWFNPGYVVANVALGIHLFHGFWSMFQSLGWNSPRFNQWRKAGAVAIASLVVVGNVSFPIAVLAGVIEHPSV